MAEHIKRQQPIAPERSAKQKANWLASQGLYRAALVEVEKYSGSSASEVDEEEGAEEGAPAAAAAAAESGSAASVSDEDVASDAASDDDDDDDDDGAGGGYETGGGAETDGGGGSDAGSDDDASGSDESEELDDEAAEAARLLRPVKLTLKVLPSGRVVANPRRARGSRMSAPLWHARSLLLREVGAAFEAEMQRKGGAGADDAVEKLSKLAEVGLKHLSPTSKSDGTPNALSPLGRPKAPWDEGEERRPNAREVLVDR